MIGPSPKKMPDKLVCTGCDVRISKTLGGTPRFPRKKVNNYCKHPGLNTQIAFIKDFPRTPKWCPVLKGKE